MCSFCKIWLSKVQHDWQWHYLMLRRFYLRIELWCFESVPGRFPCTIRHQFSIRGRATKTEIPDKYWSNRWNGSRQVWLGVIAWTDNGVTTNADELRVFG